MGEKLMYNHIDKLPEAWMSLNAMLASGKLKRAETSVRGGLERWAKCVDHVYASQTFGRMILAVDAA
jgi:NADPH-dependent curcumin reductase CurA